jgi:protein-S-isoprenylcysteine O-methyltransferase Ste14
MLIQILLAAINWLLFPLGWPAVFVGQRRLSGRFGTVISQIGKQAQSIAILVLLVPWIGMPILEQPRFSGSVRSVLGIAGALLVAAGVILSAWGMRTLIPSTGWADDINPEYLVTKGPYKWIRHPISVAGISLIVGYVLLAGAVYSFLLCPIPYLVLRCEAYLEEKRVLEPKFVPEFRRYKEQVQAALFGRVGTGALTLLYLLFAAAVLAGMVPFVG